MTLPTIIAALQRLHYAELVDLSNRSGVSVVSLYGIRRGGALSPRWRTINSIMTHLPDVINQRMKGDIEILKALWRCGTSNPSRNALDSRRDER